MALGNDIQSGMPIRSLGDVDHLVKSKIYDSEAPNALGAGQRVTSGGAHSVLHDINGNVYDTNHPFPVQIQESEGVEIHSYFASAAAITQDNSDNHDYTVTAAKTFHLEQWAISASGEMKGILQVESGVGTGVFNDIDVMFTSSSNPTMERKFKRHIKVPAGAIVRVVRINLEDDAQGMYSIINGLEV